MAGVHLDAFVAEEVGFAREFQVLPTCMDDELF